MTEPSITIRASALGGLFDCAYRFEGIHLLKMRNTVGLRAALGTAIHAGSAVFDQARISGDTVTLEDAVGVLVDKLRDPENEYDPNKDDLTKSEAESIGITLLSKYCREVSPNYNFVAVEMKTKPMDIDCGGGIIVQLTGTMDRARIKKSTNGIGINSANVMIAEAISHVAGIKFLIADEFDLLDLPSRSACLKWLIGLARSGEIDSVLLLGTLKEKPAKLPPEVTAHWIQDGIIVDKAMEAAA